MAGTATEESGVGRSFEGISNMQQRCQSSEALADWRSSEQLENGSPSTSPPYWDSDDDDFGPKPSELYRKETWKIEKFSQNNKRELKSNPFEVGGYKWYILIYPQGCDVYNHLSLFLCVANHDKLLPGWSHFAQFTIAVVNKDPKKSKYSDTLHRFWKKEHDWGWKKFMELSKVLDGFIDSDTLIIKAQVQVIRERADRPFRCLDCQYRRELVRVYLTNVEQICRRFVEERRGKLGKLIEDKARWSSFCAFWLGIDQNARRLMSREKTDSILKVVVKHFFIEKEVTSTLVMDSLYSGLKALEYQTKSKKGRGKYLNAEELPVPIVRMEKDTFILVDDVLLLLERAAMEPLPPKDEKGPQNRTKDGGSGEDFSKDSIERDERRLTELGRRTIEIFVLAHIFSSKIEVAYQEAVALKRQEELIREEEAAWMAESEQKTKRGAADKGKKSKKKQGKQKRNNDKGKDKGRDEKPGVPVDNHEQEIPTDGRIDFLIEETEPIGEPNPLEDASDVSDSINCVPEIHQPDSEDRDSSPVNWDTDTSEVHPPAEASSSGISGISAVQNGERKYTPVMDDSSSTCSTDSLPSVVMNGTYTGNSLPRQKNQKTPSRGRHQQAKVTQEATGWATETNSQPSDVLFDAGHTNGVSLSCKVAESGEAVVPSLQHQTKWPELLVAKKEKGISLQRKLTMNEEIDVEKPSKIKTTGVPSSPRSPPNNLPSVIQLRSESKSTASNNTFLVRKSSSDNPQRTDKTVVTVNSAETIVTSKLCAHKTPTPKPTEKPTAPQVPVSTENPRVQQLSKIEKPMAQQQVSVITEKPMMQQVMLSPLSAPLIPGPLPPAPVVSMVQTAPALSRSVGAASRLGPDPSPATSSYAAQSYRNAMMGNHVTSSPAGYSQPDSPNLAVNSSHSYSQLPALISTPIYYSQGSDMMDMNSMRTSLSFGMVSHDVLQNGPQWMDSPQRDSSRSINCDPSILNDMQNGPQWMDNPHRNSSRSINHDPSLCNDMQSFDMYKSVQSRSQDHLTIEFPAGTSGRQNHGVLADEFPHLDIINDLLDEEYGIGRAATASSGFQSFSNGPHHLNRQFTFPGDIGVSGDMGLPTSSCRFERTRSYPDGEFHRNYNSTGGQFDSNLIPQTNLQPYPNGQIDRLMPNQRQMSGSDLSYLSMRSSEKDGFSYQIPEYSNGVNGYNVYRPSGGH